MINKQTKFSSKLIALYTCFERQGVERKIQQSKKQTYRRGDGDGAAATMASPVNTTFSGH